MGAKAKCDRVVDLQKRSVDIATIVISSFIGLDWRKMKFLPTFSLRLLIFSLELSMGRTVNQSLDSTGFRATCGAMSTIFPHGKGAVVPFAHRQRHCECHAGRQH